MNRLVEYGTHRLSAWVKNKWSSLYPESWRFQSKLSRLIRDQDPERRMIKYLEERGQNIERLANRYAYRLEKDDLRLPLIIKGTDKNIVLAAAFEYADLMNWSTGINHIPRGDDMNDFHFSVTDDLTDPGTVVLLVTRDELKVNKKDKGRGQKTALERLTEFTARFIEWQNNETIDRLDEPGTEEFNQLQNALQKIELVASHPEAILNDGGHSISVIGQITSAKQSLPRDDENKENKLKKLKQIEGLLRKIDRQKKATYLLPEEPEFI